MAVMTPPGAWVIASSNLGKISEFKSLFEPFKVDLIAQADLGIKEVPEPHPSFVENALVKAREASRLASLPALSDDSGICIEQLQDRPGVHSARWSLIHGGSAGDAMNNE
ncbi:MAG: non-canonical purine NTP pyrophosphatase, partial [Betaproteobacteria bacterium]|nr:non-canonical purine NTP pyrophosphatase [Betaproteobacteria bacterium]